MKNIKRFLLSMIVAFAFFTSASAATGSIVVSSGTSTAVVGSTFTVTVKVSCSDALGSWQFGITYDSSYISLQSGDTNVASYGDGTIKTKTYTYKFKAIKAGTASIKVSAPSMVSWNDDTKLFTPSVTNATVTVKTQAQIEASYSKDNYLKNLSIEGYTLSPAFSKETTEYTVAVPDTVESIKVSAQVNDSTARVSGTGTIDISEGINKIEVVVTAQNGSLRTYTITVDVKDLNPILASVSGTDYTVVKKLELLTAPVGYTESTILIDGIEVPAYKSEMTGYTIIGLKDGDGLVDMFIYDEGTNTYTPYREIKGASLTLYPKEMENIPDGFTKDKVLINEVEYEALKSVYDDEFFLIYAMNVENGETSYYIYDKDSSSFAKYDATIYEAMKLENRELKLYMAAIGGVAGILLLITLIMSSKNSKLKNLIRRISSQATQKEEIVESQENEQVEEVESNILDEYTAQENSEKIDEEAQVEKIEKQKEDSETNKSKKKKKKR